MNLYPAIDLYEGKVVRLRRGDFTQKTVYSEDPGEMAKKWEDQGAEWLHIVDLEGAKTGILKNFAAVQQIRERVKCRIQFGGGLRHTDVIQDVLAAGIDRLVVGTKALDEKFLTELVSTFSSRIAVGLDVRDGKVQSEGWVKEGGGRLEEAINWLNRAGVETLIYTDIHKDGMLQGPDFGGLEKVLKLSRSRVILSGGVGALEDVSAASKVNHARFEGLIIGKALYDNKFSLKDALQVLK